MYDGAHSVIFEDKEGVQRHSYDDWCLIPSGRPTIAPPSVQEFTVEVPGRSGKVDFGDAIHKNPVYNNRQNSLEFVVDHDAKNYTSWIIIYSQIMRFLHGRWIKLVLTDEPDWYYEGRLSVNEFKSNSDWSTIVIDYDLQPYKYSTLSTYMSDWLWDPFNFVTGYIRSPEDFKLKLTTNSGQKQISISELMVDTQIELDVRCVGPMSLELLYRTLSGATVQKYYDFSGLDENQQFIRFMLPAEYPVFALSAVSTQDKTYNVDVNFNGAML